MAELYSSDPLTPEELAANEFDADLNDYFELNDAGSREAMMSDMQDKAVKDVNYFAAVGAARAEVLEDIEVKEDGTPLLSATEKAQALETLNEVTAPFARLETYENAKPEELPSWEAARNRVARALTPEYSRKSGMESDDVKRRLGIAQREYAAMDALLATDPDVINNDAWRVQYEGHREFLTRHGRIQLENANPEVRLRKAVEDLSAALEAHGLDERVMNVILRAHTASSEEAQHKMDSTGKKPGTGQVFSNISERLAELRNLDCVDPAIMAEAELAYARADKAHYGQEAGKRAPNPTAETGGAMGNFLAELGKVRLTNEAIAGIDLSINEKRLTAELGGERLEDITGPAYETLELYKRKPTIEGAHAIRVHESMLEMRMNKMIRMLDDREVDHAGDPRPKPADWAVLTRMFRDTKAAYINVQLIKRQDDLERANGTDDFGGKAGVRRTEDGGYAFRASDRRVVVYPDRSYAEDFGIDTADLAAAKDPADTSELDTTAAGYGQRRHADGTEWTDAHTSVDTLTARSELQVYLNSAADAGNPNRRMMIARGIWLAHQGDPAICQMAAQATHNAREHVLNRIATLPEADRAKFSGVLNQMRYFELKQSGEGTYDDEGRDLITAQEQRGTGDTAETWNVQYYPSGSRRLRGRVAA